MSLANPTTLARIEHIRGEVSQDMNGTIDCSMSVEVSDSRSGEVALELTAHYDRRFDESMAITLTEQEAESIIRGLKRGLQR